MSYKSNISYKSGSEYSRCYTAMRGVDFSGDGSRISKNRFSGLVNMWRDYDGVGAALTESVPGFRKILSLGKRIYGIHRQRADGNDYLLVHAGSSLYRFPVDGRDAIGTPTALLSLAEHKSVSFPSGSSLFLLDGTNMIRVAADGSAQVVGDGEGEFSPYVPTTYLNGEAYEQRNLLTCRFKERYTVTSPDLLAYGTPGLSYAVTDEAAGCCELTGMGSADGGVLYVPAFATVKGRSYRVTHVAAHAFAGLISVTEVRIPSGVVTVGEKAFSGCSALAAVYLPPELTEIGAEAFRDCTALTSIHFGKSLTKVGADAFLNCPAMTVHYAYGLAEYRKIEGAPSPENNTLETLTWSPSVTLYLPLYEPASEVSVGISGVTEYLVTEVREGGHIAGVLIFLPNRDFIKNREVLIEGKLSPSEFSDSPAGANFLSEGTFSDGGGAAIRRCLCAEVFDGRIFLSGNPAFPNTVFFSARGQTGQNDPTYFGVLNYMNDGVGSYPVKALLPTADALVVFKKGDDGGGSIYYHTPRETGISLLPKIYPTSYIHAGISACGGAISFFDDPLFVSETGISALSKQSLNLERSIVCRSHSVNAKLLTEDLSAVVLDVFCGYLVAAAGGRVYLADSRATYRHESGATEYEWYYLSGIGTYTDDRRVYRYAPAARVGYTSSATPDAVACDTVYSEKTEAGETVYFVKSGEEKVEVYPTEEYAGGIFHPAVLFRSVGDLLFFGTENGDICVFNTDRRGVAPERIRAGEDFDEAAYKARFSRVIHPDFYYFDRHAPHYELITALDDCGIPHLAKDTVKNSLVLKCQSYAASRLTLALATDREVLRGEAYLPSGFFSFSDVDFSALPLAENDTFTVPLALRARRWTEQQIAVVSDAAAPFGIYTIAFRFRIRGRIRAGET